MLFIGAALLALLALWNWFSPAEPKYAGRKLSSWADQNSARRYDHDSIRAIHAMGASALPSLLRWLPQDRDRAAEWRQKLAHFSRTAPRVVQIVLIKLGGQNFWATTQYVNTPANRALTCFDILGQEAAPAIPGLVQLAQQTRKPQTARLAIFAMTSIGTNSAPALYGVMMNRGFGQRAAAVEALGDVHPTDTWLHTAVTALLTLIKNEDVDVQRAAIDSLGKLKAEPDLVVPVLIEQLKDPNLIFTSVRSLGRFGEVARSADGPLREVLKVPGHFCEEQILETLRDINSPAASAPSEPGDLK